MRFLCSTSLSNVSRFQETLEILRKHPIFGFCSNTLGIHLITSDTIEKKQRNSIVHDKGPPLSSLAHCLKTIQNVSFQSSLKQNCSILWELRFWGWILVKNVVKWDFLIYFQTLCFSSACFLCTIVQMVRYRFFGSASALLESQTKKKNRRAVHYGRNKRVSFLLFFATTKVVNLWKMIHFALSFLTILFPDSYKAFFMGSVEVQTN